MGFGSQVLQDMPRFPAASLRFVDLSKIWGGSTVGAEPATCVEELLEETRAGLVIWVGWGLRESLGVGNGVSLVNGEHRLGASLHLLAQLGEKLTKKQGCLPVFHTCCLDPCASSTHFDVNQFSPLINLVPPHMCTWSFSSCSPCAEA